MMLTAGGTPARAERPPGAPVSISHRQILIAAIVALMVVASVMTMSLVTPAWAAGSSPSTEAGATEGGQAMSLRDAIILGLVEGVTEYLPVSSTGHLLLTEDLLGISGDSAFTTAADSYAIAIQFGAILAVVLLYWSRLLSILRGIVGRDKEGRRVALALIASFVPAAVIGFLGEAIIKDYLFALWPITAAWLVGGVVILLVARHDRTTGLRPDDGARIEDLTVGNAIIIGLLQCVAMWPGVSRSLITILGGRLVGLSTIAAVEYSFLLGLVTLTAATVFETASKGGEIIATFGVVTPVVGVLAAFVSAALAVKWMVSYLNRHTLAIFGWYRIALAVLVAVLIITAVL